MTQFEEQAWRLPRRARFSWLRPFLLVIMALVAILLQVYLPLFFQYLAYLEIPLLVTVYFSLMRRQPVVAVFYGAGIGLVQDSLSSNPLGMYGIVKTLVAYFAASVSQRFDVDNLTVRFLLGFFFFFFHQFFYWVLARALLGQALDFVAVQTLLFGLMNAAVAVPLFYLLDKL